jgi:hypothetical protein
MKLSRTPWVVVVIAAGHAERKTGLMSDFAKG